MIGPFYGTPTPPVEMSAACQRGAHWECCLPGCKCSHHDYGKKPDKRKEPAVGQSKESKEKVMAVGAGKY